MHNVLQHAAGKGHRSLLYMMLFNMQLEGRQTHSQIIACRKLLPILQCSRNKILPQLLLLHSSCADDLKTTEAPLQVKLGNKPPTRQFKSEQRPLRTWCRHHSSCMHQTLGRYCAVTAPPQQHKITTEPCETASKHCTDPRDKACTHTATKACMKLKGQQG